MARRKQPITFSYDKGTGNLMMHVPSVGTLVVFASHDGGDGKPFNGKSSLFADALGRVIADHLNTRGDELRRDWETALAMERSHRQADA